MDVKGFLAVIVVGAFILFALIFGFGSWKIVDAGTVGVSVTLGKVDPQVRGEGFTFKKPLIESIVEFPTRQQTQEGKTQCFSSDLQTVDISYQVMYRYQPESIPNLYQKYSSNPETIYSNLIESRWQESIKQAAAKYTAEDIVKKRDTIKDVAIAELRDELKEYGIYIIDVPLKNIDLTDQLEKAIETKQVMQQQALAKVYELDKAKKEAEITIVNATAEAQAIKLKGEAIAANPKIVDLEIVQAWKSGAKVPDTVVTNGGGANILLPLSK